MADVAFPVRAGTVEADTGGDVADYFALMKPRVMFLVVFTALVGLVAAPGSMHPVLAIAALHLHRRRRRAPQARSTCGTTPISMRPWRAPPRVPCRAGA